MAAKRGKFDDEEVGSLVENNLVVTASVVLEQSFERSLDMALQLDSDWKQNLLRTCLAFVVYNAIKSWSLVIRDEKGKTRVRELGATAWRKCKEWIL